MAQAAAQPDTRTLSDLLSGLSLAGQTWCYTDIGEASGFNVPPGDAVFAHFVLHGSVRIAAAGGNVVELAAGEAVFALSGEAHAVRASADAPVTAHPVLRVDRAGDVPLTHATGVADHRAARVLSGRLRATWPSGARSGSLPSLLRIGSGERDPVAALLGPGAVARAGIGVGSAALLTRLAAMLLVAALRADPHCRTIVAPPADDPVARAVALIEANPSAPWSVERLARSVGMGRSSFAAHFTTRTGRSPMEVVVERRMDHAAALLRQGRLKVAEISELSGYGSEAAFSRRFSKHFGQSPSQMREAARAEADRDAADRPAFPSLLSGPMLAEAAALGRQPKAAVDDAPLGLRQTLLRARRS